MIQFFRQIRQNLLIDGKTSKYLKYAIGEIALVMIGILLALQVNNWKEARKDRVSELKALFDLKKEFETNKKEFEKLTNFKKAVSEEWRVFLWTISDKDLPANKKAIFRPRTGTRTYTISNSTLNSILNSGKIDKIKNDSLIHHLNTWNDVLHAYKDVEEMHANFANGPLHMYEFKITPNPIFKEVGRIDNPFFTDQEMIKFFSINNQNFEYRNMLMGNYYYLNLQMVYGSDIEDKLNDILRLLTSELNQNL